MVASWIIVTLKNVMGGGAAPRRQEQALLSDCGA
jgi:hypothetical protein